MSDTASRFIDPGAFEEISDKTLEILAALSAATLKTGLEFDSLTNAALHAEKVVSELIMEAFLRDGGELIGQSDAMRSLKSDIQLVAISDYTALVLGETGVGKELVARTIHQHSKRKRMPLVHVNCAALPESLAESELFGHVKGAFTGAEKERPGKFMLANGGTLFLDEIGELPLNVQSKLLRVLQNGEVQALGSDQINRVNVRIIAATNRNLASEIENGNFRSDLYHRLSIYPIIVPPLRDRKGDVALLANFFLERTCIRLGLRQLVLSRMALNVLQNYHWPGNVRELEHVINRAGLLAKREYRSSEVVTIDLEYFDLPSMPKQSALDACNKREKKLTHHSNVNLRQATDDFQRDIITDVLIHSDLNWSAAAKKLGVDRANLVRLSKRLHLKVEKKVVR
ncbi:nitric oxide reductase transcriptional regulator NorR [Aliiglaciecola sp. SL4]|uniref:nitric oxide reductase transcriptional regulator NorR n=1 Tax=Aliiglaciecola sp. SL4 TaxID=3239806 RepID=UPI00355AE5AF